MSIGRKAVIVQSRIGRKAGQTMLNLANLLIPEDISKSFQHPLLRQTSD